MTVPYTFATATSSIPLSQLDSNFATAITLGNTAVYLGNTTTSIGNLTLTNTTISSVAVTFPNSYLSNSSVTIGTTSLSLGGTASTLANVTLSNVTISSVSTALTVPQGGTGLTTLTAGYIPYGNGTSAFSSSANMTFDGSTLTTLNSAYTGTLTGGTGIVNLGSGQFYKDASGNVGIGTSSPAYKLDITGGVSPIVRLKSGTSGSAYYLTKNSTTDTLLAMGDATSIVGGTVDSLAMIYTSASIPLSFYIGNSERMRIDSSGNVLVGTTTSPASGNGYFAVKGSGAYFSFGSQQNGGTSFVVFNSSSVGVYLPSGSTAWLPATSDQRLKNKISDIDNALDAINKLKPLSFYYKNQAQTGTPQYGYFAQDVGAAIPNAMVISPNPDPVLGATYTYDPSIINVYLVAALQELSNKFDAYVASHP